MSYYWQLKKRQIGQVSMLASAKGSRMRLSLVFSKQVQYSWRVSDWCCLKIKSSIYLLLLETRTLAQSEQKKTAWSSGHLHSSWWGLEHGKSPVEEEKQKMWQRLLSNVTFSRQQHCYLARKSPTGGAGQEGLHKDIDQIQNIPRSAEDSEGDIAFGTWSSTVLSKS